MFDVNGFDGVMWFAEHDRDWLPIILRCYEWPGQFKGAHILDEFPHQLGRTLRPLVTRRVIKQLRSVRGGAWYEVADADREDVGRALQLRELGLLPPDAAAAARRWSSFARS
jgi:hypothetical protein